MDSLLQRNAGIVGGIYQDFGTGNIPGILARLAPDVAWETWDDNHGQKAGVPWLQALQGADAVPAFFGIIGQWKPLGFEVKSIMAGEDGAAAEVEAHFQLPNGKELKDQEVHLWKINGEGQVTLFRHYADTAKHIAAAS